MSDFFVKASATAHTYFKGLHGMTVFARFPKAVVIYSRGKGISRGVKKCTSYFYLKTACYTKKNTELLQLKISILIVTTGNIHRDHALGLYTLSQGSLVYPGILCLVLVGRAWDLALSEAR